MAGQAGRDFGSPPIGPEAADLRGHSCGVSACRCPGAGLSSLMRSGPGWPGQGKGPDALLGPRAALVLRRSPHRHPGGGIVRTGSGQEPSAAHPRSAPHRRRPAPTRAQVLRWDVSRVRASRSRSGTSPGPSPSPLARPRWPDPPPTARRRPVRGGRSGRSRRGADHAGTSRAGRPRPYGRARPSGRRGTSGRDGHRCSPCGG